MNDNYIDSITFKGKDYTSNGFPKGEYDNCTFINCNFSNLHLSNNEFVECNFEDCNFSNSIIKNTSFKEAVFDTCKLVGVNFSECNPFLLAFSFNNCQLNLASFYQLKLKNTKFINCNLQETDFDKTDLSNSMLANCDLKRAIFKNTNLEKVDFSTAYNYSIDPETNNIKNAKFSLNGIAGLLEKYNITIE
jgi:uncharacterized protein YjbI with pentapeptide repeats